MFRLPAFVPGFSAVCCMLLSEGSAFAQDVERIPVERAYAQLQLLREVPVSTEVTGKLIEVNPTQEGQLVRRDDVLIRVNDAVIRAEVAHADAQAEQTTEIEFASKSKVSAEYRLRTMEEANMRSPGAYNPNEMRQQQLEVDKTDAQLAKSRDDKILYGLTAEIKRATLAQYEVKAPFDGLVTQVHRYPGQNVRPGDPVLTITDMSELRAELKVNFIHRDSLFVGDSVEIRIDTAGESEDTEATQFGSEPKKNSGAFFNTDGPKAGPTPAAVASAPSTSLDGEVFIGVISFLKPTIEKTGVSFVKLSVLVQNQQDKYGRYKLQAGLPVTAVVLAKKRAE